MKNKEKQENFRLKIFLVRDNVIINDWKDFLKDSQQKAYNSLTLINNEVVYLKSINVKTPKWFRNFFKQDLDNKLLDGGLRAFMIRNIELNNKNIKFVITFGGADADIDEDFFDSYFGLKIALNVENGAYQIKREKISTTQSKTKETSTKLKKLTNFDIQPGMDLMTQIIVNPIDTFFIKSKITGSNFVSFSYPVAIDTLDDVLRRCYQESLNNTYKEKYEWFDKIKEITSDIDLIKEIKTKAFELYKEKDYTRFWLGIKDEINWEIVDYFIIRKSKSKIEDKFEDITIEGFNEFLKKYDQNITSFDDFKNYKVDIGISNSSDAIQKDYWNITDCIYCELELNDGRNYVINGGKIYEIDKKYNKQINDEYNKLKPIEPFAENKKAQREDSYIKELCELPEYNDRLVNLDKVLIRIDNDIEFCDVYDKKENAFVHIKKDGSSAKLSHLFAQAKISARLLCDKKNVDAVKLKYKEVRNLDLPDILIKKPKIVMAIISHKKLDSTNKINLPFFSKINCLMSKSEIEQLGYKDVDFMFIHSSVPLKSNEDQRKK